MLRPCRPWWLHLCPRCPSFGRPLEEPLQHPARWLGHAVSPLLQQRPERLPLAGPAQRTPGRRHSAASTPWTWAPASGAFQATALDLDRLGSAMPLPRPCRRADPVTRRSAHWTFARSLSPESSSSGSSNPRLPLGKWAAQFDSAHGGALAILGRPQRSSAAYPAGTFRLQLCCPSPGHPSLRAAPRGPQ